MDVEQEIRELLKEYDRVWEQLDFTGLSALWDAADTSPIYIGEEYGEPVIGWADLNEHWGRLANRLTRATMRSTLCTAKLLGADIAVAVLLIEWTFISIGSDIEHRGQAYTTAIFRRTQPGWRFIHFAEVPLYIGGLTTAT